MEYEDKFTIRTAEGLDLEVSLAGLGSRFVAATIDLLLKGVAFVLLAVAVVPLLGDFGVAILIAGSFAIYVGYDVLFEVLSAGRTPGKRRTGIRVVRAPGRPVDLASSAIRNVLRAIDGLPFGYLPGAIAILVTRQNQRLGDLAAGTLVVRDPARGEGSDWRPVIASGTEAALWDLSAVTPEDVGAARQFLGRRTGLSPDARNRIALQLATRIASKAGGVPRGQSPESFLEKVVAEKSAQR